MHPSPRFGALPRDGATTFTVWAPKAQKVAVVFDKGRAEVHLRDRGDRVYEATVEGVSPGSRYRYRLDDEQLFPDPASRYQPEGVHGPSEVVDPTSYTWSDTNWNGVPQKDLVFYELHVGTFTPDGSFAGVQQKLPYLRDLGITAVELMPVADFPGRWNWGYDHAALYAPSRAYGHPDDLRALVDAAHEHGLAVFLDVIYNHLGPDGAYVAAYAPLFTDKHHTPWGQAINLDDKGSDGVRAFFIDNALHWLREYHVDGLRLDATHALVDDSDKHFLAELAEAVAALDEGPRRYLVAEDPRNINTIIHPRNRGGYGIDAIWTDDLHHQIRNLTAGDRDGYYEDYAGTTAKEIARTVREGWFFKGQRSPRTGKPRGTSPADIRHDQCVVAIQNHDQVGNRPRGNRLTDDIDLATYRAASALLLFAPELPLLFMGQEWAAGSPFLFFTDHEEELGRKVTEGRRDEFKHFKGFRGDVPDPQDKSSFERSRLSWNEKDHGEHAGIVTLYKRLLALRPKLSADVETDAISEYALVVRRGRHHLLICLGEEAHFDVPGGAHVVWHTEDAAITHEGTPPAVEDGRITFKAPGALLVETPA